MNLADAVRKAKRVYLIGNGGSYANAVHICNDLLSVGVKAFTLDPASLTASANDHGYETVFSRWIEAVGESGDLLVALSGSGKSPNIVRAIATAREMGMEALLITNFLQDIDMQRSEEEQLILGHEAMKCLR
jgi:D-sedoheptulose 7-phosphate isomerase